MKVLAVETSALAASVALWENEKCISYCYQNTGHTHSTTVLPMINTVMESTGAKPDNIDFYAVAIGPGSFTGLRIGVSAVKGMAWANIKPCVAVSTLEGMAQNAIMHKGIILCAMDARRSQVYNAIFHNTSEGLTRLCEDRAIAISDIATELIDNNEPKMIIGDGALLCYNQLKEMGVSNLHISEEINRWQNANGVASVALSMIKEGKICDCSALIPQYYRMSQAERERMAKLQNN